MELWPARSTNEDMEAQLKHQDDPTDNKAPTAVAATVEDHKTGRILYSRDLRETVGEAFIEEPRMSCRNVDVYYDDKHAIRNVSLDIGRNQVIAMIGPSG
ncbi:MAG: hypothetical protein QNJ02_00360, partial [Desulfobacterales bacterium]|nr:hypothetical protein [Desulfobacterales bacterium]